MNIMRIYTIISKYLVIDGTMVFSYSIIWMIVLKILSDWLKSSLGMAGQRRSERENWEGGKYI